MPRSASIRFVVDKPPAVAVRAFLAALTAAVPRIPNQHFQLLLESVPALNLAVGGDVAPDCTVVSTAKALVERLEFLEKHPALPLKELQLNFRGHHLKHVHLTYDDDYPLLADLKVVYDDGGLPLVPRVIEAFASEFELARKNPVYGQLLKNEVPELRHHREVIGVLETHVSNLGSTLTQAAQTIAEQALAEREKLQAEFEGRRRLLVSDTEAEREKTRAAEAELAKREESLDLREHKAKRRENFAKLTKRLDEDVKGTGWTISEATSKKRHWTTVVSLLAIVAFATIAGVSAAWLFRSNSPSPQHYLPFASGVAGFGATLVYFLRWSQRWYDDHARREFYTRKLIADIQRADWLAELVFEWHENEGVGDFPQMLMERFSEGLFAPDDMPPTRHPIPELSKKVTEATQKVVESATKVADSAANNLAKQAVGS